jgi:hypothetical protein
MFQRFPKALLFFSLQSETAAESVYAPLAGSYIYAEKNVSVRLPFRWMQKVTGVSGRE